MFRPRKKISSKNSSSRFCDKTSWETWQYLSRLKSLHDDTAITTITSAISDVFPVCFFIGCCLSTSNQQTYSNKQQQYKKKMKRNLMDTFLSSARFCWTFTLPTRFNGPGQNSWLIEWHYLMEFILFFLPLFLVSLSLSMCWNRTRPDGLCSGGCPPVSRLYGRSPTVGRLHHPDAEAGTTAEPAAMGRATGSTPGRLHRLGCG
jgi:hypothetical protein